MQVFGVHACICSCTVKGKYSQKCCQERTRGTELLDHTLTRWLPILIDADTPSTKWVRVTGQMF